MQGIIPNVMEGFSSNSVSGGNPALSCEIQEMTFWMWRVKAIGISINITINPPSGSGDDPQSLNFSDVVGCPINGSDGPWRNEQDQLVRRVGFRNRFNGIVGDADEGSIHFNAKFCEAAIHDYTMGPDVGWYLTAGFSGEFPAALLNLDRESATESSISMLIFGEDPIRGGTYSHVVPIWNRALANDWTVSGGVTISPVYYYPWRDFDTGSPLFNENTGEYA
jgi:hypothetical protein